MVTDNDRYRNLEAELGYHFRNPEFIVEALTHKSAINEKVQGVCRDNERLEFLGDAVLSFCVSNRLLHRFPKAREGELSRMRAFLVDEGALAALAGRLHLGKYLILGRGEELTGGREKRSILSDAVEALLAAVFLDGGTAAAISVVDRLFTPMIEGSLAGGKKDHKTELQELVQALQGVAPEYRLRGSSGPDHDRRFVVEVAIGAETFGVGEGKSKKEAEQAAAGEALGRLKNI